MTSLNMASCRMQVMVLTLSRQTYEAAPVRKQNKDAEARTGETAYLAGAGYLLGHKLFHLNLLVLFLPLHGVQAAHEGAGGGGTVAADQPGRLLRHDTPASDVNTRTIAYNKRISHTGQKSLVFLSV